MTDDNSNPVDMESFDNFKDAFFKDAAEAPTEEVDVEDVEETDENEDNSLATDDDEDVDTEEEDTSEEEDEESEPEEKPEPKGKKRNRAQERIEKLYADNKHMEREMAALKAELESFKTKTEAKTEEKEETLQDKLPKGAPKPDDVDENGLPKYELGEFDKKYIADLSLYTARESVKQMMEEQKAQEEEAARVKLQQEAQAVLKETWENNLAEAEKELPDIREKISTMSEAFEGIDPGYGEYLAGTIMSCEYGPEIMYYLSQNIGEAQKIVASGPASATLAIGRLEAQFIKSTNEEEAKRNKKQVSKASAPPEQHSRGTAGRFAARGDTRDFGAFKREFFKD